MDEQAFVGCGSSDLYLGLGYFEKYFSESRLGVHPGGSCGVPPCFFSVQALLGCTEGVVSCE